MDESNASLDSIPDKRVIYNQVPSSSCKFYDKNAVFHDGAVILEGRTPLYYWSVAKTASQD